MVRLLSALYNVCALVRGSSALFGNGPLPFEGNKQTMTVFSRGGSPPTSEVRASPLTSDVVPIRKAPPDGFLPNRELDDDAYFSSLRKLIVRSCGPSCSWAAPSRKGRFFDTVTRERDCAAMFSHNMTRLDGLSNRWPPPQMIPESYRMDFLMGDRNMSVQTLYREEYAPQNMTAKNRWMRWEESAINSLAAQFRRGNFKHGVPRQDIKQNQAWGAREPWKGFRKDAQAIRNLIANHKDDFEGMHCAVVGSQTPWLEALLLSAGVQNVTTIEYAAIVSEHPQITVVHPSEWGKMLTPRRDRGRAGTGIFDCAVSHSSLEHAGLGRYGDIVNPWGDIIAMEKIKCSVKMGGVIILGVPVGAPTQGRDGIAWNAHRYYGPKRWSQMLSNTKQLDFTSLYSPSDPDSHGLVAVRNL